MLTTVICNVALENNHIKVFFVVLKIMDSFPKLLPMWHDVTLQDFLRQRGKFFDGLLAPNYGGIGTDINNNINGRNSGYTRENLTFAANRCALPFLTLNKIHNLEDPCLEAMKREKSEFDKFCLKLSYMRKGVKRQKSFSNITALLHHLSTCKGDNGNDCNNIKVPENLIHLAENLPKRVYIPRFNVEYAGGALGVSKSFNTLNLLHPVGKDLNKLCITPLQIDSEQNFKPDSDGKKALNLDKEIILQIEPAINDFCCVRQKDSFHVVNMANMNIYSKKVKSLLYHVAVSPYNPLEILSIHEKGMMKLMNIETRKTLSLSGDLYYDSSLIYPTWRCGFGSHFFSALCMNEKKIYSVDFREKSSVQKEIFSIENPSCYIGEELVHMKLWNKNPFQHLVTSSHHLIICDERYLKKPVLYWNHTLKHSPLYLECADLDSNVSCIVTGTQATQELVSFLFSHETDVQPISMAPPLLLSSPTDCIESLKLHSYYVDNKFSSRLASPLTGVCVVPNDKEIAFTVLQSTSLGDVFYQDFKQTKSTEKTYHVSTGCVLTPPEKILPQLNEWILDNTDSNEKPENIDGEITHLEINIGKILSPPKEISSNCTLCRLKDSSDKSELVISGICPYCNLNSAESEHFSKAVAMSSAIIGPVSDESALLDCDMDYLLGFEDSFSKRILSVWLESDNADDRETTYDQSMLFEGL